MGLDMYLKGKKYVEDWEHNYEDGVIPDDTPAKVTAKAVNTKFPVMYVEVELGYWRKANAIHKWFVENVQDGQDDCSKQSYVSIEQLQQLVNLCKTVKADMSRAPELLPSQEGFFFGSTEYDENYIHDLDITIEQLTKVISCGESNLDIYYQSSW